MNQYPKIYVGGHCGLVDADIIRVFIEVEMLEQAYVAIAKVGGLHFSKSPRLSLSIRT